MPGAIRPATSVPDKTWIQNRVILRAAAFWRTEGSVRAPVLKRRLSADGPSLLLLSLRPRWRPIWHAIVI